MVVGPPSRSGRAYALYRELCVVGGPYIEGTRDYRYCTSGRVIYRWWGERKRNKHQRIKDALRGDDDVGVSEPGYSPI